MRPRKEETEGKGGVTERRRGLHVGDGGQKGAWKLLAKCNALRHSQWVG